MLDKEAFSCGFELLNVIDYEILHAGGCQNF